LPEQCFRQIGRLRINVLVGQSQHLALWIWIFEPSVHQQRGSHYKKGQDSKAGCRSHGQGQPPEGNRPPPEGG
jgi:hypothetical protein